MFSLLSFTILIYVCSSVAALITPGISLELKHSINKNPYYKEILHICKETNENEKLFPLNTDFLIINSKFLKDSKVLKFVGFNHFQNNIFEINSNVKTHAMKKLQFPKIFDNEKQSENENQSKGIQNSVYVPFESNVMFIINSLEPPTVDLSSLRNISMLQKFSPPFRIPKHVRMTDFYLLLNKNYLTEQEFSSFDRLHSRLMAPVRIGSDLANSIKENRKTSQDISKRMSRLKTLASFSNVTKPLFVIQFESFDDSSSVSNTSSERREMESDFIDTTLPNYIDPSDANKKLTYFDALSKAFVNSMGISSLAKAEFCSLNLEADKEYCLSINSKSIQISPVSENRVFKRDVGKNPQRDPLGESTNDKLEELVSASLYFNDENIIDESLNYRPKFNPALFSGDYLDSFMNFEKSLENSSFINSYFSDFSVDESFPDIGDEKNPDVDEISNQTKDDSKQENETEDEDEDEEELVKRDVNDNHVEIDLAKLLQNIYASRSRISKELGIPTNSTNIDINRVREALINQYSSTYDRLSKGLLSKKTFGLNITTSDCKNEGCEKLNSIQFFIADSPVYQKRDFEKSKKCLDVTWNNVFSMNSILDNSMICREA